MKHKTRVFGGATLLLAAVFAGPQLAEGDPPTNSSTQTNTSSTADKGWLAGANAHEVAPDGSKVFQWGEVVGGGAWTDHLRITAGNASLWADAYLKDQDGSNNSSHVRGSALSKVDISLSWPGTTHRFLVVTNEGAFSYNGSLQTGDVAKFEVTGWAKDIRNGKHDCSASDSAMKAVTSHHKDRNVETEDTSSSVDAAAQKSETGVKGAVGVKVSGSEHRSSERERTWTMPPGGAQPISNPTTKEWKVHKHKIAEPNQKLELTLTAEAYALITLGAQGLANTPNAPATGLDAIVNITGYTIEQTFGYQWGTWDPTGTRQPSDPVPEFLDESGQPITGDPDCDPNCTDPVPIKFNSSLPGWWNGTLAPRSASIYPGLGFIGCGYPTAALEPGLFHIELEYEATEDMDFSITTSPTGATDLPSQVTIPAGKKSVSVAFVPQGSAQFTVTHELLDSQGQPTGDSLSETSQALDPASEAQTKLRTAWSAVRSLNPYGPARIASDAQLPDIEIRRTAFDDAATEATTVAVAVVDPGGVLNSLPTSVTIPAGAYVAQLPLSLTGQTGTVEVELSLGAQEIAYEFEVVDQKLVIRTPRIDASSGTMVRGLVMLPAPAASEITISVSSGAPTVAAIPSTSSTVTIREGMTRALFDVSCDSVGTAVVSVASSGLTGDTVDVVVRAQEYALSSSALTLSNLDGSNSGYVVLRLPENVEVSSFAGPAGSSTYMSVDGVGTSLLILEFEEGVARPPSIPCTISFSGAGSSSAFDVVVIEDLTIDEYDWHVEYILTVN